MIAARVKKRTDRVQYSSYRESECCGMDVEAEEEERAENVFAALDTAVACRTAGVAALSEPKNSGQGQRATP